MRKKMLKSDLINIITKIDKEKSTIQLSGENIIKLTKSYTFKDGIFTVDISGMKHDYYKKDSKAYQEALKKYGYQ